jgi:hypothetical protein
MYTQRKQSARGRSIANGSSLFYIMASPSKVPKLSQNQSLPDEILDELAGAISNLCSLYPGDNVCLGAKELINSNAKKNCNMGTGFSFSNAFCELTDHSKCFVFGDVFRKGLDMAIGFFLRGESPVGREDEILLEKLITCLKSGKIISSSKVVANIWDFRGHVGLQHLKVYGSTLESRGPHNQRSEGPASLLYSLYFGTLKNHSAN